MGPRPRLGTGGLLTAVPLVTHGAPQAEGSDVDANWILGINDTADVIAADFEDTATGLNHPVSGVTPITKNVWHHAAATYDGTTWRLYLDGNLEATEVENAAPEVRLDPARGARDDAPLRDRNARSGSSPASLDEPRVWNRALSATEIQTGMSQQLTSGSGLVARWGLNEGTATSRGRLDRHGHRHPDQRAHVGGRWSRSPRSPDASPPWPAGSGSTARTTT